MASISVQKLE